MLYKKKLLIGCLLIITWLPAGCTIKPDKLKNNQENKNILLVIPPIEFQDDEFNKIKQTLINNSMGVKVASIQGGIAVGSKGTEAKIDLTVSDADINSYAGVIFIGGTGTAKIINDDSLQVLAIKFDQANKLIGAISAAPAILARAGILANKQATSGEEQKDELIDGKAIYLDQGLVFDGNLVTAQTTEDAEKLARYIISNL